MNNGAMYKLSYGLFVLTAKQGDKDNGCIINTAAQVTTTPNRITVAVNKANYTHDMIMETKEFNLSILTEDSKFDTFKQFGFQSGRDVDKLVEIEYKRSDNGIVYLTKDVNAYISGKVIDTVDLGTHTLFIADVTDADILAEQNSVTYTYYQQHIKPAPKPTAEKGFICTICGYIYKGDVLPEDYICPICKHPASDFKPL